MIDKSDPENYGFLATMRHPDGETYACLFKGSKDIVEAAKSYASEETAHGVECVKIDRWERGKWRAERVDTQLNYPFWITDAFLSELGEAGCDGCQRFIHLRDDLESRLVGQPPPDGKEAKELRAGIETLMQTTTESTDDCYDEVVSVAALQNLLDIVDARDSLHHLQREDLAKTAEAIQKYRLSVLVYVYTSPIDSIQFMVADKPPPGRPIRAIADDRKKAVGSTLVEAVKKWLSDYAEDQDES